MPDFERNCPCEAVIELKDTVKELRQITLEHEKKLAEGTTNFALIKQDLEYIKGNLDGKKKFNSGMISSIVQIILTIILGYIAVKLGIA